jgi:hypothetical protein
MHADNLRCSRVTEGSEGSSVTRSKGLKSHADYFIKDCEVPVARSVEPPECPLDRPLTWGQRECAQDAEGGTREMKVLALESLGAALVLFGLSGLLIKLA